MAANFHQAVAIANAVIGEAETMAEAAVNLTVALDRRKAGA